LFNQAIFELNLDMSCLPGRALSLFQESASLGHAKGEWVWKLLEEAGPERDAANRAFASIEDDSLALFLAASLSDASCSDYYDYNQKSAAAGCFYGWGELAYAELLKYGLAGYAEPQEDEEEYWKYMEKSAAANNFVALFTFGRHYQSQNDPVKAHSYFLRAAELGSTQATERLIVMKALGNGCKQDRIAAVHWAARIGSNWFEKLMSETERSHKSGKPEFRMCYALGEGMYWHMFGSKVWSVVPYQEVTAFGERCLKYYCEMVELQQESICTFLLFWNRAVGVKDIGVVIGKKVWEERKENLIKKKR
jgi:TPR repeat protein